MPETIKPASQAAPAATTNTSLYLVPAATTAIVSTIVICNRNNAADTFRLMVNVGDAAVANKAYIVYDMPIGANATITLTLGITLGANDRVMCYAGTANLSFNLFGTEIT